MIRKKDVGTSFRALTLAAAAAVLAPVTMLVPMSASAGVFVSINLEPPALPVYEQPECPSDGFIWTPGYWAYGGEGYYWVPGAWVSAPQPGYLWTPGYWGYESSGYRWHGGYWGEHIGFYGGVNYGFGYGGSGYEGGYWRENHFYYNRSVNHINEVNVHNVYNKTVINNVTVNRVSYNGGPHGVNARASHEEEMAAHDHHIQATSTQRQYEQHARSDRGQLASVNHGNPANAARAPERGNEHGGVVGQHGGQQHQNGAGPAYVQHSRESQEHGTPQQIGAQHQTHTQRPVQNREAGQQHAQQQQHVQQQHTQQQPRVQQQQHFQQQRAQPQQHSEQRAPQQHMEQQHAAPQQHEGGGHQGGGHEGGGHEGGGGGGHRDGPHQR